MTTRPEAIPEAKRDLIAKYLSRNIGSTLLPQAIPRRDPQEPVPLSPAQEQVWLHAQMALELPLYNEPVTIHYSGKLNVAAFERSFNEILRRHEIWRTSFSIIDGQPFQVVHSDVAVTFPVVDLRRLSPLEREAEALRLATQDATRPIDLAGVPLFRYKLLRLDDERYRLYLTLSHIIFDGVAIYRVLLPELSALYSAFSAGSPSPLAEPPRQYGDYSIWQRQRLQPERLSEQMDYWRRQLEGDLPVLNIPADRPRPPVQSFRGSMYPFRLDRDLMNDLKGLARREGVTLFQTLLAAFAVLLRRYTGSTDILIGTVTSGRDVPETQSLLGYFLNTVVLRLKVSGDLSFRKVLDHARRVAVEALMNDAVPFGQIVHEIRQPRDPSRNPLFNVLFTLEPPMEALDSAWQLTQMDVDTGATKYDLYLELDERSDAILARFHYSTDLFNESTIVRMAKHLERLLVSAVTDPDATAGRLALLSESERNQILFQWNDTGVMHARTTVQALFEARVLETPAKVAVEYEGVPLTYAELNARANQLAWQLKNLGVGPEIRVAVCIERSPDALIALLAVLKVGGAYIPIDPLYPEDRLSFLIEDAVPFAVVTRRGLEKRFPEVGNVVVLDLESDNSACRDDNPESISRPEDLAYAIYTSGSTGLPKGVLIEHRSFLNCLLSMQCEPGFKQNDVLLAVTTLSFDIAGLEMMLPLITGGQIVIASEDTSRDAATLRNLIHRSRATVMQATPTTWRMLIDGGWRGSAGLKILCGGETLSPDLAIQLVRCGREVWNLYGPTETTIWSSVHHVDPAIRHSIPIGRPIRNTQIYLLDENLEPVPPGVSGEICIGGHGVARGYLNRPELTALKFIADPFLKDAGFRMYRTGDLGRIRPDGIIEYSGRADTQVKIRGHRVELGEIESTLPLHPAVRSAVAVVRQDISADPCLVAYVVPAVGSTPGTGELREFLRSRLPEYMLPSHFEFLDELPRTSNGKIDRKRLPVPSRRSESAGGLVAPRNETEERLAEIWESVLGLKPVGIHDDFMKLGGTSLAAVRMTVRIEKSFGTSVPLATLLRAPTIAQLAVVLDEKRLWEGQSTLIAIEPGGTLPSIFCVHGHFGEVLFYRPLSQMLGSQQPFFALQGVQQSSIHETIESKARDYLSAIQRVQQHGPYYIAGYCFGAMVAFEMGQQLLRQGESVAFLGLFMGRDPELSIMARIFRSVDLHLRQWQTIGGIATLKQMTSSLWARLKGMSWEISCRLFPNAVYSLLWRHQNIQGANLRAARRYTPQRYPGRMTVFLSGAVWPGFRLNPDVDLYGMNADHIDLRIVPGDRDSMMREPYVSVLAEQLRLGLDDARSAANRGIWDSSAETPSILAPAEPATRRPGIEKSPAW